MGRPTHYSTEIATRCQRLIDTFAVQVRENADLAEEFRGPLRTTFLLALATPMIVLPMERLYKPLFGQAGVADDTQLDAPIAARVRETFDGRRFGEAAFFAPHTWAYIDARDHFPVAEPWPAAILDELDSADAEAAAEQALAKDVIGCLRNALAHGGVAYLDRRGRQSEDATDMLAFAARPAIRRQDELRLLRVSIDGVEDFLGRWTRWLAASGIEAALDDRGPGWLDAAA